MGGEIYMIGSLVIAFFTAAAVGVMNLIVKAFEVWMNHKYQTKKLKLEKEMSINESIEEKAQLFIMNADKIAKAAKEFCEVNKRNLNGSMPKIQVTKYSLQAIDDLNEGMEKTFSEITSIKLIMPESKYKNKIIDDLEEVRSICEKITSITIQVESNKEQLEYIEQKELEIKKEISFLQNYVDKSINKINCYINKDLK